LILLIGLLLLAGIVASFLYLKLTLTTRPVDTLRTRGSSHKVKGASFTSHLLLTFQLMLSIITFSMGLIFYQQQEHINAEPLGLELEETWIIRPPLSSASDSLFQEQLNTFKSLVMAYPEIVNVASNQRSPGQQVEVDYEIMMDGKKQVMGYIFVDQDYVPIYNIGLTEGRNFTPSDVYTNHRDVKSVIVNRKALQGLEIKNPIDAIGKQITVLGSKREIVGVVEDYRQMSLLNDFQPLILFPYVRPSQIVVRSDAPLDKWLSVVKGAYNSVFQGSPFEYWELSTQYYSQYKSVYSSSEAFRLFTILIIMISLFGMTTLVSLNLLSRIKEIGIRKVLGASESNLYRNVLKTYLRLLAISCLIASPVIYFISQNWISQFRSRIEISLYYYVVPTVLLGIIITSALLLISRRVILSNPVKILRAE
jgi:putative ABC transport system permease protein